MFQNTCCTGHLSGFQKLASLRKEREKRPLTKAEALEKLRHFCAWQERSIQQVLQKMQRLELQEDWKEEMVATLQEEKYLDPERFARSFVRGKSRMKGWGPAKIKSALARENVSLPVEELFEFQEEALQKLRKELRKKWKGEELDRNGEARLIRFCLSRGYSMEVARKEIREMLQSPFD